MAAPIPRRRLGILGAATALSAGMMLVARPAQAYVQFQTSTGAEMAWAQNCVPIVAFPGGFSQMTAAEVAGAVAGAASAWSSSSNSCSYLDLEVTTSNGPAPAARNDGINAVIFDSTRWCASNAGVCTVNYDPTAVTLTTTTVDRTGRILDADVEVNAVDFQWADVVAHPELTDHQDLQNGLAHAFGHLLGLDSPCYESNSAQPRPVDNNGQPVVDCDQASASVQAETMFPSSPPGETQKRTLAPDDQAGVCGIYPLAANPRLCQASAGSCTCATIGDASAPTDAQGHLDAGGDMGGARDAAVGTDAKGSPRDAASEASVPDASRPTSTHGGCTCSSLADPPPSGSVVLSLGLLLLTLRSRQPRQRQVKRVAPSARAA
jgi:hypothetical protein